MIKKHGSLELAMRAETESFRDEFIERQRGIIIPMPLLRWLIKNSQGTLPDIKLFEESIDPLDYVSLTDEVNIKRKVEETGWPLGFSVTADENGKEMTVKISGLDPLFNEFAANIGSLFLAHRFNFKVTRFKKLDTLVEVTYALSDKEEAIDSVYKSFAYNQVFMDEISRKPEFWRDFMALYKKMGYNMVALSRHDFEKLLGEGEHLWGLEYLEKEFGKPLEDIPLQDVLFWFKKRCKLFGIINELEFDEECSEIKIHHEFTDERAIEKLAHRYLKILEASGRKFELKKAHKMLIFERTT
jgi:hypothetical protein